MKKLALLISLVPGMVHAQTPSEMLRLYDQHIHPYQNPRMSPPPSPGPEIFMVLPGGGTQQHPHQNQPQTFYVIPLHPSQSGSRVPVDPRR